MIINRIINKAIRQEKRARKRRTYYNPPPIKQYTKKYLLTKHEYNFYWKIKPIAERYNLQILAKIRLADLIEPDTGLNKKKYAENFEKIKSLHIDFAIADNMKIVCLIELDDSSHQQNDRIARDNFVNSVLYNAGYTIIHTYGDLSEIERQVRIYKNL